MSILFPDLHSAYHELKDELDAAYRRVMESGWYILGKEVDAFEGDYGCASLRRRSIPWQRSTGSRL